MQPVASRSGLEPTRYRNRRGPRRLVVPEHDELEWFADLKDSAISFGTALQHYHYSIRSKRSGGVRLIEMPKPRLKELQRRILSGILDPFRSTRLSTAL